MLLVFAIPKFNALLPTSPILSCCNFDCANSLSLVPYPLFYGLCKQLAVIMESHVDSSMLYLWLVSYVFLVSIWISLIASFPPILRSFLKYFWACDLAWALVLVPMCWCTLFQSLPCSLSASINRSCSPSVHLPLLDESMLLAWVRFIEWEDNTGRWSKSAGVSETTAVDKIEGCTIEFVKRGISEFKFSDDA